MNITDILIPVGIFAALGVIFGVILAVAAKIFEVKVDERVPKVLDCLPGANCGGCGFSGCAALAEAIVKGEAKPGSCTVGGSEAAKKVGAIMGVEVGESVRMRAQVMCSGTSEFAKKKYVYAGAKDCISATKLAGGDKLCPNGCVGLGTCVAACPFGSITVVSGVAVVDYKKCEGCGVCTHACPKGIIKLIPYNSRHWVGCMSVEKGAVTRKQCDVGCISCKMCEKSCEYGAIKVTDFVAAIDYEKCVGCDKCVEKCPRHIIWSASSQDGHLVIVRENLIQK